MIETKRNIIWNKVFKELRKNRMHSKATTNVERVKYWNMMRATFDITISVMEKMSKGGVK